MRFDLGQQQTLFKEREKMTGLDIIAILAGSNLEVRFVEHRKSCMVQSHLGQVLVDDVVNLVTFQNYAHLSVYI